MPDKIITNDNEKDLARLQAKAYARYQMLWMADHGYNLTDFLRSVIEHLQNGVDPEDPDDNDITRLDPAEMFIDWEADAGFGGACWAGKDEFLATEWQIRDYMKCLLPDPADYQAYEALLGADE